MDEIRKALFAQLNKVFKKHNVALSQIGRDAQVSEIDPHTGTWKDVGLFSKTPRFIVQFKINSDGSIEAGQFKGNATSGKLGYINTTNRNIPLCGVFIRILPVFVQPNGEIYAVTQWEWAFLLIFTRSIAGGSSSDTIDHFYPPKVAIKWNGRGITKDLDLSNASLYTLAPSNEKYIYAKGTAMRREIIYDEATVALNNYLSLDFNES